MLEAPPQGNGAGPRRPRPLRLPRTTRIRRKSEFSRVWKEGVRARGRLILAVAAPSPTGEPRLGLSVGRKYDRSAVARNRARRLLREAFRLRRPELPALDFVLVPLPALHGERVRAVEEELVTLAGKLAERLAARGPDAASAEEHP